MSGWVELYEAAFHVVNLPATLLLILVLLYWMTVIFGVLDLSSLDMDIELPDADVDADVDLGDSSPVGFEAFLAYFNIRYVPISIFLSLFGLSFWVVSMLGNMALNPVYSGWIGVGILVVNIPISAHVAKYLSLPFVPLFRSIRDEASANRNLIGSRVVVTSSTADPSFGQAEIQETGAPITLSVRTEGEVIPKGTEAVIMEHNPEDDIYIITTLEI